MLTLHSLKDIIPLFLVLGMNIDIGQTTDDSIEYTTVYSSCTNVEIDGLYYIKPMPDLPILPVICSNGYAMIDGSLDLNLKTLPYFLTSYDYARTDKDHLFSALDDLSTFREWFIPSDSTTKFKVAPNCNECISGDFDDNTVYYTDSHLYCFSSLGSNGCLDDINSFLYHPESCNTCDAAMFSGDKDDDFVSSDGWTKCFSLQMDADHAINHDHITCVSHGLTFHPVISAIRDGCSCYQSVEIDGPIPYQVLMDELPLITSTSHLLNKYGIMYIAENIQYDPMYDRENQIIIDQRDTNIVYLYNKDFVDGTLRIKESGTYVIMEDIIFNFNAPTVEQMAEDGFSPNTIDLDELYWFPTHEQSTNDYPGLYTYSGSYTLGFFAGITIETEYVTIDLNGYTLKQDDTFYFQQRFFALIELGAKPFIPGQGPANWGAVEEVYASNVVIKDGNLGLSSHHGIHGNNNINIEITNINIANFDVTGIQCNGCTNVLIENCLIGPQNMNIPLLGRYAHARSLIPRLKQVMDEGLSDTEITFYNRDKTTISALIYRLIDQMDMIYKYINNGVIYDDDDDLDWIATKKLFLNPSGWMDGGASYGILIAGNGAQVTGIGSRPLHTQDITISNVEIFDIGNQVIEKIKFAANDGQSAGATRLIFFDAIDWVTTSDQINDLDTSQYIGDAYTDVTFAMNEIIDSWYFFNSLYITDDMKNYVFNGDNNALKTIFKQPTDDDDDDDNNNIVNTDREVGGCNTDIQLHSSKGAIGIRIDGVQNLNMDNIYIHDIYNWADLGNEEWCGQYEGPTVGNEDIDIQYGYTGTRSHGFIVDYVSGSISNIEISNIESYNGEANGMTVYKGCDIILENIVVNSIHAGTQLNDQQIEALNLPNLVPRACGVDIRPNTLVTFNQNDNTIINGNDISGFNTCYDDDDELFMNNNIFNINRKRVLYIFSVLFIILMIMFIMMIYGKIMVKYFHDNKGKKRNDNDASEITPLLI